MAPSVGGSAVIERGDTVLRTIDRSLCVRAAPPPYVLFPSPLPLSALSQHARTYTNRLCSIFSRAFSFFSLARIRVPRSERNETVVVAAA